MLSIDADIAEPRQDASLTVRLPVSLKRQLRRLARAEDRKLGDLVRIVLEQHVSAKHRGEVQRHVP